MNWPKMPKERKKKSSKFRCCVCYENSISLSYFAFPKKQNIKEQWLSFFNLQNSELTDHSKVCSKHFDEDNFFSSVKDGHIKRILKKDRIPTLFPSRGKITRKVGVQKCVICGPSDGVGNRCYFPFPAHNDEVFQEWLQFCELTPEELLPSYRLCSDHFTPEVINGSTVFYKRRNLNPNAVPSIRYDISDRDSVIEVVCTLNKNDRVCDESLSGEIKNDLCQSETHTNADEVHAATILRCTPKQHNICSQKVEMDVKFELLSEEDDENNLVEIESRDSYNSNKIANAVVLPSTPKSSQHPGIPKRLGDIYTPHLNTPRRAKACLSLAKKKLKEKNRIIKTLKQSIARFRKKIGTFKALVRHLKQKDLYLNKLKQRY